MQPPAEHIFTYSCGTYPILMCSALYFTQNSPGGTICPLCFALYADTYKYTARPFISDMFCRKYGIHYIVRAISLIISTEFLIAIASKAG